MDVVNIYNQLTLRQLLLIMWMGLTHQLEALKIKPEVSWRKINLP